MNIHEHQAKEILKEFGAPVSNGFVVLDTNELDKIIQKIKSQKIVLKAQIHAGGRGKAGGVKLVDKLDSASISAADAAKSLIVLTGSRSSTASWIKLCEILREGSLGAIIILLLS